MKDGWKSFRTDEKTRAWLKALKEGHVGRSDGERCCLAIKCLYEKHFGEGVPA